MSNTNSSSNLKYQIPGAALFVAVVAATTIIPASIACSSPRLIQEGVLATDNLSKSVNVPGEIKSWEEIRIEKIRTLKGKYRNLLTDSDTFSLQKNEEVKFEE